MSANWISRKLRRQRHGFSSDAYAHTSITRSTPPIAGVDNSREVQLTGHNGQPQNRTTVTVKGQNGAKKTVITIRKVYKDAKIPSGIGGGGRNERYNVGAATAPTPGARPPGTEPKGATNTSYSPNTTLTTRPSVNHAIRATRAKIAGGRPLDSRHTLPMADAGADGRLTPTIVRPSDDKSTVLTSTIPFESSSGLSSAGLSSTVADTGAYVKPTIVDPAGIMSQTESLSLPVKRLLESQIELNHPLSIHSESSVEPEIFMDAVESFGVETPASPSTTVKGDCPQLKSPGSFTQSVESAESLATVIVDDGLSSWGLPKVMEHAYDYEYDVDSEMIPEDPSLQFYGIELGSQLASTVPLRSQTWKLRTLIYMASIVLTHKRQLRQRKQEQKEAALRAKLHLEREKQQQSRHLPFFASWI